MLIVRDDFTRLNTEYSTSARSKDGASRYLSKYLADYRFTSVPSPADVGRNNGPEEFKE